MENLYMLGYVFFAVVVSGIIYSLFKMVVSFIHFFSKHEKSKDYKLHHEH
jgi:hypothetical protein